MSEHDSHDDPALSALYRRMAQEAPPASLDERVLAAARRHATRRAHRWWLPLSTAAVLVLTLSLLLRHQQEPDLVRQQVARLEPAPAASAPEQPAADTAAEPPLAAPRTEARTAVKPEAKAKAAAQVPAAEAPLAEPAGSASSPAEVAAAPAPAPAKALAAAPAATDLAESKKAETRQAEAAGAMARSSIADEQKQEVAEAPEAWLKRIEALRVKGELEAARRELVAFRTAYPGYVLPKELQVLLPETAK